MPSAIFRLSAGSLARRRLYRIALLVLLIGLGSPGFAHAYLDPGSGSMILQVLLGGIASGLVVLRLLWRRIRRRLGFDSAREEDAPDSGGPGPDAAP